MRTALFTTNRRLPAVSRISSCRQAPSRTTTNFNPATKSFQQQQFHQNLLVSQRTTVRSFSTQFREDYDAWYSHGCTGVQTRSDQRSLFFGDNTDIVTFGVHRTVSELETMMDDDYDLEDQYLDYSEDEFENWFPSTTTTTNYNDTIVSVEKLEYHPDTASSK